MKNTNIFAAVAVLALALTGCSSYTFTSRSNMIDRVNIEQAPMIVDVRPDFNKRIEAESRRRQSANQAMEEAKYNAIVENKCDVIVDPIYKVEKQGGKYRAYLTGFAGYYKNARTIYEDIQLLKDVRKEDLEKYLILKDPAMVGVMNPANNSEVINIYEGKAPCDRKEVTVEEPRFEPRFEPAPEPAPEPKPATKSTSSKKRKK